MGEQEQGDLGVAVSSDGRSAGPADPSPSTRSRPEAAVTNAGWLWWSGPDDEMYRCGPCETREQAIAEALSDYGEDCSHIYVIEAMRQDFPAPSASQVIDHMFESADELFGEDWPEPTGTAEQREAAETELQEALSAWMEKWRKVIFPVPIMFLRSRNAECVPAASADTHPQGGDAVAAPFMSGAVGAESDETPTPTPRSDHE